MNSEPPNPRILHLDFETFSPISVKDVGHTVYSENRDTDVMIIGWALDDDPVQVIHLPDGVASIELRKFWPVLDLIRQSQSHTNADNTPSPASLYLKIAAHNYAFERDIWNNVLANPQHSNNLDFPPVDDDQWTCTAARSRACGLPGSLEGAATALKLSIEKDSNGSRLINRYSIPQRGVRVVLAKHPHDRDKFMEYCANDVRVERELDKLLPELHPFEQRVFALDMEINDRGIPVNQSFLNDAIKVFRNLLETYEKESLSLTGYKPSQSARMLDWFNEHGLDIKNMQAKTIEDSLKLSGLSDLVMNMLEIRYDASRAGPKKLPTVKTRMSPNGRVKGGFIYHGATTARWTATGIQTQNFGKTNPEHQDEVTQHIITAASMPDPSVYMRETFQRPLDEMSMSLRSVIKASPGQKLVAADYSSIEARVLAWLAEEDWLVESFRQGVDAYKHMASNVFSIEIDDVDSHQRFVGKQLVLGCGYTMSGQRFMERCMDFDTFFTLQEANHYVSVYRKSVPKIVKLWARYAKAAVMACHPDNAGKAVRVGKVKFRKEAGLDPSRPDDYAHFYLTVELPTKRKLYYQDPKVRGTNVMYRKYLGKTMVPGNLYGGFYAQNITQAISRDLLCEGMFNVDRAGYPIVMHIHDDICSEVPTEFGSYQEFEDLMAIIPPWAQGLPINAEGWERETWRK